ncbi:hypothetical protein KGF56_001844 [Candida oxycetoniae]|uniref:Letm1 RBD domain-containing protein n=1 Tax=Candida oxycetoniae TaxID=497107 RepID=A0AAI9WYI8_9ASCO|nr:uncharacterized protein KGF56_001844 [Candida oxycetoniae]KAI3405347.2 hypothetical protein KGF56_001844 [Candida oxycetoniae]
MSSTSMLKKEIVGYNGTLFQRIALRNLSKSTFSGSVRFPLSPGTHTRSFHRTGIHCYSQSPQRFQSIKEPQITSAKTESSQLKSDNDKTETKSLEKLDNSPTTQLANKADPTTTTTTTTSITTTPEKGKKSLWEKVKHEAQHYWTGTKLLGYEIKVSTKLLIKLMAGYGLSRRESNQLQRTIVDVVRLVPFAMFVIIPFAELLLPVALKLFPNLLPSTYESKQDRQKKKAKLRKTRNAASEYIKQTMEQSGLKLSKKITDSEREAFIQFFEAISLGKNPTREQLIQVARLFKNDQVLDNLSRHQLVAMCKYMSLRPFGTDSILRYQIRHRLLNIIKDDKAIDYEGVNSLTIPELQMACSQRGIKTSDVSPARLRDDLETWLDLRLRQKIPSTLLILSTAYTYGSKDKDAETYYDALLAVLSSIPDEVYNVAKLELADDSKLKLNILKEQDELIEEENEREKDTVNNVKDDIHLDDYEDTASDGVNYEKDPDTEVEKEEKEEKNSDNKEVENPQDSSLKTRSEALKNEDLTKPAEDNIKKQS